MKKDEAIKKALNEQEEIYFSSVLRNKILLNIDNEDKKLTKRKDIYSIILVSCISITLVAGSVFLLVTRLGLIFKLPTIDLSIFNKPLFHSSLYLASIILLLLIVDELLRKRFYRFKSE